MMRRLLTRIAHRLLGHPYEGRGCNAVTGAVWCRCGAELPPEDAP